MRRWIFALGAAGALAASAVLAQEGPRGRGGPGFDGPRFERGGGRPTLSPEDRAAFMDARIAALHAGLKLTSDQEKLWPPVEDALRGLARQRQAARAARQERFASMQAREAAPSVPDMLRFMADRQTASGEVLRKLADATAPLYAALDEGQKKRLTILGRGMMTAGMRGRMGGGMRGPGRD